MIGHAGGALDETMKDALEIHAFVRAKATKRLNEEGRVPETIAIMESINDPNKTLADYAMEKYAFYMCATCAEPYCGGDHACAAARDAVLDEDGAGAGTGGGGGDDGARRKLDEDDSDYDPNEALERKVESPASSSGSSAKANGAEANAEAKVVPSAPAAGAAGAAGAAPGASVAAEKLRHPNWVQFVTRASIDAKGRKLYEPKDFTCPECTTFTGETCKKVRGIAMLIGDVECVDDDSSVVSACIIDAICCYVSDCTLHHTIPTSVISSFSLFLTSPDPSSLLHSLPFIIQHGKEYLEFKCRFCCSRAVWFCWGTTRFCEPCHRNYNTVARLSAEELPPCPALPENGTGLPCALPPGSSCPLGIAHGPPGVEQPLGCSLCRLKH